MVDSTIVRLVDEQRSQIRWLALQAQKLPTDSIGSRALVCAAVRALQIGLTAYFAELTQTRFDRKLWPVLLASQTSFITMSQRASLTSQMLAEWLEAEADSESALSVAQRLIACANEPAASGYRSGLLSSTSLSDDSNHQLIASSSAMPVELSFDVLMPIVAELEAVIERQRAQNLEC